METPRFPNFGKHANKSLDAIPPDYLVWAYENLTWRSASGNEVKTWIQRNLDVLRDAAAQTKRGGGSGQDVSKREPDPMYDAFKALKSAVRDGRQVDAEAALKLLATFVATIKPAPATPVVPVVDFKDDDIPF